MPRVREYASYFSSQVSRTRRFYFTSWRRQVLRTTHLDVVGGGCEWCSPDFLIERETFPHIAFEFVSAGKGRIRMGRKWHELTPGLAFIFDSSVPHLIRSDANEPLVKYFFNFAGSRAAALLAELKLRAGTVFRIAEPARLIELLEEAIDCALHNSPLALRMTSAVLEHALLLCAQSRGPRRTGADPAYATYLRCRNFLFRQYPVVVSVVQAARSCGVSAPYLTRLFQRYDTETPYECLRRLKLNEAFYRLRLPNAQAKAVAAELGFKSAAHFSRAFKKFHGMAPRESMRSA